MAEWHVYLVRCGDRTLYTGIATDVARRFAEHQDAGGKGAKFLRGKGPLELVYERPVGDRSLAQRVEARIKKLPRAGKERLLRDDGVLEALVAELGA